jgi:hypothetical protein
MSNKNELLARFSELEKEIKENGSKQSAIRKTYEPQIAKLENELAAKEEEKKTLSENKPLFSFTRAGKEHAAKLVAVDKEIEDIRNKIKHVGDDNKEYSALKKRYSVIYPEYKAMQEQLVEFDFNEKLGENCVMIFATGHAPKDLIEINIDGKEMGTLPSPVGFYPVGEGAHTVTVTRNYGITESVQFRLNGTNKYLFYKFEYYGNGYSNNASNTFEEFVRDNGVFAFNVDAIKKYILSF